MVIERDAMDLVAQGELDLPPLEVRLAQVQPSFDGLGRRPDWILDVAWDAKVQQYAVQYVSTATPKRIRNAAWQIRALCESDATADYQPMIMAPYLSRERLDYLAEQQLSGIDLSGNAVVIAPGDWFVLRSGAPNKYPSSSANIKNVYRGTSSLVCRVILSRRSFRLLKDIQAAVAEEQVRVSLGTVSKVAKALEEDLIISRTDGIRLMQPAKLLDNLAANAAPPRSLTRFRGRFGTEPSDLLRRVSRWARESGARVAVSSVERYSRSASSDTYPPIYTDRPQDLAREFSFEERDRFSNAEIRETSDAHVFFDVRREDGVLWQGPVEAYLELMQGGKRERELAAGLRSRILQTAND